MSSTDTRKYGFPAKLWRAVERRRPPGPGRTRAWRSPLRGPWLTSVFGLVLLVLLPVMITTGLLSYAAYAPRFETAAEFPVNRTATSAAIRPADVGESWRLLLVAGARTVQLDRGRLLAMPQHTAKLPIACVEGWSTVQTWSGVRLRDLAALAGVPHPVSAHVRSLERGGAFSQATLQSNQVTDPDALLALRVGGADLSPDHGYPARVIVPALPGVHNTKWVRSIEFRSA
jgi:DMSO/TMAO reductase YedYZ molybdopterin-dependent catalytic subunit